MLTSLVAWIFGDAGAALAGWLSLTVAAFGLPAIFRKTKSANANAESAKSHAANAEASSGRAMAMAGEIHKAIGALEAKLNISNASYAGAQLSTLLFMMQNSHLQEAQSYYVGIKRNILQAHHDSNAVPEHVRLAIKTVETQLLNAHEGKSTYSLPKLYRAIHGLIEQMDMIEKISKAKKTTELSDANDR